MAERSLVQARDGFTIHSGSGPVQVRPDDLFWSDDPLVMAHRALFGEPKVRDSVAPPPGYATSTHAVETATSAPGERRTSVLVGAARKARATAAGTPDDEV